MANINILGPNDIENSFITTSYSGGAWLVDRPLTNLADPLLVNKARSFSTDSDDTQFKVIFSENRSTYGIALTGSNLSRDATYRIRAYDVSDTGLATAVYDSGTLEVFRVVYEKGSVPWVSPYQWDGKRTEEERTLYDTPILAFIEDGIVAGIWLIEIFDDGNEDGYVEFSRLFIAAGYIPSVNMSYGSSVSQVDESVKQFALGGAEYADEREVRRSAILNFPFQPQSEVMAGIFDAQRKLKTIKQVFFAWDPDDTENFDRRSFPATYRRLSDVESVIIGYVGVTLEVVEAL